MAKAITDVPKTLFQPTAEAGATRGTGGAFATQTAQAAPTAAAVIATPTAVIECVKVVKTGGNGVLLRKEARTGSTWEVQVGEGAFFQINGADVTDRTNSTIIWRNVMLPRGDGRKGYVQQRFLETVDSGLCR
jgi:hypothetical protein